MRKVSQVIHSPSEHLKDLTLLNSNIPFKTRHQINQKQHQNISNESTPTYSIQQTSNQLYNNIQQEQIKDVMSKSLILLKKNRKKSKQEKFKKDFMILESEICRLSPQNTEKFIMKTQKILSNMKASNKKESPEKSSLKLIENDNMLSNMMGNPRPYIQIETFEYDILEPSFTSRDQLDIFNKILDSHIQSKDLNLELQSKFIQGKKVNRQQLYKQMSWTQEDIVQSHQQLLQEENKYIRQNLIKFTQIVAQQRQELVLLKGKYKNVKKEHFKIISQSDFLKRISQSFEKQRKEQQILVNSMLITVEQYAKNMKTMQKRKNELEQRLQALQVEYEQFQQKFSGYRNEKQKQIECILQQKQKQKNELQELIYEKHKEIEELNAYIHKMNSKKERGSEDSNTKGELPRQNDKDLQETNSICLSLAEAESLKFIIEAKQQTHRQEIAVLVRQHEEERQKYMTIIDQLTQTVKQFQIQMHSTIQSIYNDNQSTEENSLRDYQLQDQGQKYCLSEQFNSQLKTMHYGRRIKKLYRILSEERQQKVRLIQKIATLQEHCLNVQKEQDEQMQQLFQKCVNELQKQKQINMRLNMDNSHLKSRLNIMYGEVQRFSKMQY